MSRTINQIAKRVNFTVGIYSDDINDIKKQIDHISKEIWQITLFFLKELLKQEMLSNGNNKNSPYKINA